MAKMNVLCDFINPETNVIPSYANPNQIVILCVTYLTVVNFATLECNYCISKGEDRISPRFFLLSQVSTRISPPSLILKDENVLNMLM